MASGATIYKALLDVSDVDRGYYGSRQLTIARHPSETEGRMMVRLLAYCLYAGERVQFGRGLSSEGDAAVWDIDEGGDICRWIEVGCPEIKVLRRAAGRSGEVVALAYGEDRTAAWWESRRAELAKIDRLTVLAIADGDLDSLAGMAARTMRIAATIQDGTVWLADDSVNLEIHVRTLQAHGRQQA